MVFYCWNLIKLIFYNLRIESISIRLSSFSKTHKFSSLYCNKLTLIILSIQILSIQLKQTQWTWMICSYFYRISPFYRLKCVSFIMGWFSIDNQVQNYPKVDYQGLWMFYPTNFSIVQNLLFRCLTFHKFISCLSLVGLSVIIIIFLLYFEVYCIIFIHIQV